MEQRGASLNVGADSCTEMHLAGRQTSSSVKFFGELPENIEGHHLHPRLSGQLFSVSNFMFLYAVDHILSCLSSRNKQLSPVTTLKPALAGYIQGTSELPKMGVLWHCFVCILRGGKTEEAAAQVKCCPASTLLSWCQGSRLVTQCSSLQSGLSCI